MAKESFWVLIETDTDKFDNPDEPAYSDIQDTLRNERNFGIIDFIRESDVEDIVTKSDK